MSSTPICHMNSRWQRRNLSRPLLRHFVVLAFRGVFMAVPLKSGGNSESESECGRPRHSGRFALQSGQMEPPCPQTAQWVDHQENIRARGQPHTSTKDCQMTLVTLIPLCSFRRPAFSICIQHNLAGRRRDCLCVLIWAFFCIFMHSLSTSHQWGSNNESFVYRCVLGTCKVQSEPCPRAWRSPSWQNNWHK